MDAEAWMRDWHCEIKNEWDAWSRKKWKKVFQVFESTWSDSSLSVIIANRRTLRAVKRERKHCELVRFSWLGTENLPKTAGSISQQVKSNALSATRGGESGQRG